MPNVTSFMEEVNKTTKTTSIDVPPEKFYFEIFSKTNAVSITFGLRYIHGQSLKEIDFPTRNEVDRF